MRNHVSLTSAKRVERRLQRLLQWTAAAALALLASLPARAGDPPAPVESAAAKTQLAAPVVAQMAALGRALAAPITESYRLTSAFGVRRGRKRWHLGVDLAAPRGTSVRALAAGLVKTAGRQRGYGRLVIVTHANGYETRYAHLNRITVKEGDRVLAGQKLGTVGSTGRASGPHLHFELRRDGKALDPSGLIAAAETRPRIVQDTPRSEPRQRILLVAHAPKPDYQTRWRE